MKCRSHSAPASNQMRIGTVKRPTRRSRGTACKLRLQVPSAFGSGRPSPLRWAASETSGQFDQIHRREDVGRTYDEPIALAD